MRIPTDILAKFHAAGLLTSEPFSANHVAFPDGIKVAKPATTKGNSIPRYGGIWGLGGPTLDAPTVILHREDGEWIVTSHDREPGPGPGDFVNRWRTADEAVADIMDFYFGDPYRMSLK